MINSLFRDIKAVYYWRNNEKSLDDFLKGMMLFNFLFFIQQFRASVYVFIFFQIIIAVFFLKYIKLCSWSNQNRYFKFIGFFLLIWSLFIVFNSSLNVYWLSHLFFKPYNYLCLFLPFILIKWTKKEDLFYYLNFCYKSVKIGLFILVVFFPLMNRNWAGDDDSRGDSMQLFEVVNTYLNGGLIFILLFINEFTKKERTTIYIATLFSMFCSAYFARRGVLLSYVITYILSVVISLSSLNNRRKIYYIFITIIASFTILYLTIEYGDIYFSYLFGRINDDTRTGVELEVMEEIFGNDYLLYGKGIDGTYYSIWFGNRDGVETGYLHLILKGGIVYLLLMALYTIPAIFLGLFKSNNLYAKICAVYIVIFIIIFNVASSNLTFTLRFVSLVLSCNLIYSKKFRIINKEEFKY